MDFFAANTKLEEMAIMVSKDFSIAKTKLPTVVLDPMITGSKVYYWC